MSDSARREAIEERAAEWLGRHDGGLSSAEQADFERWLLADRRHADAFERLERCSRALDRLSVLRPVEARERGMRRRPQKAGSPRRGGMAIALVAAALALAATILWPSRAPAWHTQVASTRIGESQRLALPDGSTITLNTDSELAIDYQPGARHIDLRRGEAHFVVARDTRRPFVVRTGGVGVRAVGTAFNVRRRQDQVEVVVTSGRVDVQDVRAGRSLLGEGEAAPALQAGERMIVKGASDGPEARPTPVQRDAMSNPELGRRLAWQEKRLEFGPTPLREIVAEFNRYSNRPLVLADRAIEELSVGGSFRAGDDETLIRLLESSFGIVADRRETETRLKLEAAPGKQ